MPADTPPPVLPDISWESWESPLILGEQTLADTQAAALVNDTLLRLETWRLQNLDPRWSTIDRLFAGAVEKKLWEGSRVERASLPVEIVFDQVIGAEAALFQELLARDVLFSVAPEGATHPLEAAQIRDRLNYVLDHSLDDYGWTGRLELGRTLLDLLLYGNCFAWVEWDAERKQAAVRRLDPRDVYVDPATPSPYVDASRANVVKRELTIDQVESLRGGDLRIPSKLVLMWLARNRANDAADSTKSASELARGMTWSPVGDSMLPFPAANLIDLYIYMGEGREIWTLGRGKRSVCVYNERFPYKCSRLVSAPCFPFPNRFYAQSYVDKLDPLQRMMTGMMNKYLDEMSLALNPPRVGKRGVNRQNFGYRPGGSLLTDTPKDDLILLQPAGLTANIWPAMNFLDSRAQSITGRSALANEGRPAGANADRTLGGMQLQMNGPTVRLARIVHNWSAYLFTPLLYKILKVEKTHASESGFLYGKRYAEIDE